MVVLVAQPEIEGTPLPQRLCVIDEFLAFSMLSNGPESARRSNVIPSPEVEVVRRSRKLVTIVPIKCTVPDHRYPVPYLVHCLGNIKVSMFDIPFPA